MTAPLPAGMFAMTSNWPGFAANTVCDQGLIGFHTSLETRIGPTTPLPLICGYRNGPRFPNWALDCHE